MLGFPIAFEVVMIITLSRYSIPLISEALYPIILFISLTIYFMSFSSPSLYMLFQSDLIHSQFKLPHNDYQVFISNPGFSFKLQIHIPDSQWHFLKNNFIEMTFTHYTIHTFKVYNWMAFSTFTDTCNHHQFSTIIITSERNPVLSSYHSIFPPPPDLRNH